MAVYASSPVPRASSPYREHSEFQYDTGSHSHHKQPQANEPNSSYLSTSIKNEYELLLEQAREESLVDAAELEGPPPQPVRAGPPTVIANTRSLHPEDAHRRSIEGAGHPQPQTRGRQGSTTYNRGPPPSSPNFRECRVCKKLGPDRSFCNICTVTLCNSCWAGQITHGEDIRGPDNIPHEKTSHDIAEKVQACLDSKLTDQQQKALHRRDENTTWFGVSKDDMGDLIFQDCGRFAGIMADGSSTRRAARYPSLVSFVGETGAGKSSLIKMLIEFSNSVNQIPVPVVGSVNHSVPTSGDVHLYSDPTTYNKSIPILYADCEGLRGGETEPMAAQSKRTENAVNTGILPRHTGSFQRKFRKKDHSSKREITWANTEEKRSRQFAVTNLYPRLLYTFSDVVVFVLKNARTIESVVEQLITWAQAALEKSTNQPVLPHLIIALNATENGIQPQQWEVDFATDSLMRTVTQAMSTKPSFKRYIDFWRERRRNIRNAQELLCSYYSSVRIVRIPAKGRPQLISEQLGKLYDQILSDCRKSHEGRRRMRMLLDADELQNYLQYAFDHFASDLDMPFDFVKACLLHNPIPRDFGGNILKLAINIMDVWTDNLDGEGIFDELSPMIASCIMLDATRHRTPGTAESIFREHYMEYIDDAIEDFCDRHWRCEARILAGRCANVKSGHSVKGHQLQTGKTFGSGPYQSSFSAELYSNSWKSMIYHNLELLLSKLHEASNEEESQEQTAMRTHKNSVLTPFFRHVKTSENYVSHSTCFSCLVAPPQHALPCGHVICTPCLQATGVSKGKTVVEVQSCPLWHERPTTWNRPWQIVFKPISAGVRILTLDGTGGIIALGLGAEGWSIDECISQFVVLCKTAFTPRRGLSIWGLAHMIQAHNGSIYETQPLQKALMTTYSDNALFGGPRYEDNQPTKVAVTATSAAGLQPIVISNYNRINGKDEKRSYVFQRPEKPEPELKIWEAARATSAAPTYYKPFPHEPSKQTYLDGGIWHNNPVAIADSERKLIWPDMAQLPPDILLSIGSGYCRKLTSAKRPSTTTPRTGIGSNLKALFRIAVDHIESSLDSEKAWGNYLEILSPGPEQRWRYARLNVMLEEAPPRLDDVGRMEDLQQETMRQWKWDERITYTAQHLIATCFYFEKTNTEVAVEDDSYVCSGYIRCRFVPGSQTIRDLGLYLRDCESDKHSPYFIVQEKYRDRFSELVFSRGIIDNMMRNGNFHMQQLKFKISSHHASSEILICLKDRGRLFPISGFPRILQQEDATRAVRQPGSNTFRWRTRSQQISRGQWSGPISSDGPAPDDDTISRYSDPDYVIGNSSMGELAGISRCFKEAFHELPDNDIVELGDYSLGPAELPDRIWSDVDVEGSRGLRDDLEDLSAEFSRVRHNWAGGLQERFRRV